MTSDIPSQTMKTHKNTGTAWTAFTKKIVDEKKEEISAYTEQRIMKAMIGELYSPAGELIPVTKARLGSHIFYTTEYRKKNEAEWLQFQEEWKATPVSYTHLTLPTKRIV